MQTVWRYLCAYIGIVVSLNFCHQNIPVGIHYSIVFASVLQIHWLDPYIARLVCWVSELLIYGIEILECCVKSSFGVMLKHNSLMCFCTGKESRVFKKTITRCLFMKASWVYGRKGLHSPLRWQGTSSFSFHLCFSSCVMIIPMVT